MLGSPLFVAAILLSSFNLYYFSCVLHMCFPLQSCHWYRLHFALSDGISDPFLRLYFGSGVPHGLWGSSQSPEATVSGEPGAKSQKHNDWRDLSVAEPQLHHCAFILITDNPPDRHCSAKKQLQNSDNLTIESLVFSQYCSRLFSPQQSPGVIKVH